MTHHPIGVIFDMDGVLVDSYRAHLESWQTTASAFGVEMTEADFSRTFGKTSREVIRQLWPAQFGGDDQQTAARILSLDQTKEQAYRDVLERAFPEMDGASDLIADLHAAGFKIAIGSSAPAKNVEQAKRLLRNGHLVDTTVNGGEVTHGKPAPDIFLRAAEKLGFPPGRCVIIEDALVGLEAAKRARITAIALTGTTPRDQLAANAKLVVDSLRDLTPGQIAGMVEAT